MTIPNAVVRSNEVVTFVVEVGVYVSVVAWGLATSLPTLAQLTVAVAAALAMAALWGTFAAPRAPKPLRGRGGVVFQVAWFGLGVAAAYGSGRHWWSLVLAVLLVGNGVLRVAVARRGAPPSRLPKGT